MRRFLKRLVKLVILAALAKVVVQVARRMRDDQKDREPAIEPAWPVLKVDRAPERTEPAAPLAAPSKSAIGADDPEPATTGAETASATTAWVVPDDPGDCPHGYPVKVKVSSGIYHLPGGIAYGRTKPDRCYATPQAAEADGYRAAKR